MFEIISGGEFVEGAGPFVSMDDFVEWVDQVKPTFMQVSGDNVVITLENGNEIVVRITVATGHGANVYTDDLGDLIPVLDPLDPIPPTSLTFGLLDIENEVKPFEPTPVSQPEICIIEVPETPVWDIPENFVKSLFIDNESQFACYYETVNGTNDDDTLLVFGSHITVNGNDGNDTIVAFGLGNTLNGGDGDDILIAESLQTNGIYQIDGGEGFGSTLNGNDGNDCLRGSDYSDHLYGGDGDDVLIGGGGADWLYGGAGNDSLLVDEFDLFGGSIGGGEGFDRLDMSGVSFSPLFFFYNVDNIEQVDIEDGKNDKLFLSLHDVVGMTDDDNELFVTGNEGDKLALLGSIRCECECEPGEDWVMTGKTYEGTDGNSYSVYVNEGATVYVDTDIMVETGYYLA